MAALVVLLAVLLALSGVGLMRAAAAFSYRDVVAHVRATGATVTTASSLPKTFYTGAEHVLTITGEQEQVYEYPLPLAADLDAGRISSDCSTSLRISRVVTVNWITPPLVASGGGSSPCTSRPTPG